MKTLEDDGSRVGVRPLEVSLRSKREHFRRSRAHSSGHFCHGLSRRDLAVSRPVKTGAISCYFDTLVDEARNVKWGTQCKTAWKTEQKVTNIAVFSSDPVSQELWLGDEGIVRSPDMEEDPEPKSIFDSG